MSTVVVGCDKNQSNDSKVQNTVCKALEKQGHKVEKLTIGPGRFSRYDWHKDGKNPKGKIGVFIIADGITAIADHFDNPNGFKYVYFIIRGDLGRSKMDSRKDFENNPISKDWHGDCTSKSCNKLAGKNYTQMNEICKSKCHMVFGTTADEMASEVIKAMGGSTGATGSSKSSIPQIKDSIKEILYDWNGDVVCYLRDDTVHIHRVPNPTSAKLKLIEGDNVFSDGVSLTDIDPKAPNKLVVKWKSKSFTIKDDARIKRFGEIKKTIKANHKKESSAIKYAYREWKKLLKDCGRQLECRTYGAPEWRNGEWVRVYFPSFELDDFMFLTKVSHNDDGEWETSLTLVDYPPDLGTKPKEDASKKDSDSSSDSDSNDDNQEESDS